MKSSSWLPILPYEVVGRKQEPRRAFLKQGTNLALLEFSEGWEVDIVKIAAVDKPYLNGDPKSEIGIEKLVESMVATRGPKRKAPPYSWANKVIKNQNPKS